jgi:hypothetical protein
MQRSSFISLALFAVAPLAATAAPKVTTAAGANPADITSAVAAFRADVALGGASNTTNGPFANGFRNINWDGTAEAAVTPNAMPADFFNNNVRRGAVFTTPSVGATVQVSAATGNAANIATRFGNIDASYPTRFKAFSEQRVFAAVGSTVLDTAFFVPGTPNTTATVNGMGVVFCDVDVANLSGLEFFDAAGRSLGKFFAPVSDNGLSFLGVFFPDGERVARVRVTQGNQPLAAGSVDSGSLDVVATDDFMFGEPLPLGTDATLVNMANRARIGGGEDVSVTGFVVGGTQPKAVLVRVAGPSLAAFGVTGPIANPQLSVVSGGQVIATNDDWGNKPEIQQAWVKNGAFPFAPNSTDAAVIVVLNPGPYSVVASGVNNSTGVALTEIYEVR